MLPYLLFGSAKRHLIDSVVVALEISKTVLFLDTSICLMDRRPGPSEPRDWISHRTLLSSIIGRGVGRPRYLQGDQVHPMERNRIWWTWWTTRPVGQVTCGYISSALSFKASSSSPRVLLCDLDQGKSPLRDVTNNEYHGYGLMFWGSHQRRPSVFRCLGFDTRRAVWW